MKSTFLSAGDSPSLPANGSQPSSAHIVGEEGNIALFPNEISAPYELPQFPIEQIEKKLFLQRQLNVK